MIEKNDHASISHMSQKGAAGLVGAEYLMWCPNANPRSDIWCWTSYRMFPYIENRVGYQKAGNDLSRDPIKMPFF